MEFLTGFFYFIIMVVILVAAYLTSRFLAVRAKGMAQGKYMKIVDRIMLGKDKSFVIILVGQKKYLVSENPQGFSVLCELKEEELVELESEQKPLAFQEIISSYLGISGKADSSEPGHYADALSELKQRASKKLSTMISKHKAEEQSNGQKQEGI